MDANGEVGKRPKDDPNEWVVSAELLDELREHYRAYGIKPVQAGVRGMTGAWVRGRGG